MIATRRATAEDKDFLWDLKKAAMFDYVSAVFGWDDDVQHAYFEKDFTPVTLQIIEVDGERVGMVELLEGDGDWFLSRIEITPDRQGRGIGSYVIRGIMEQADAEDRPLRLQVFKVNPARRLYQRLGFRKTGETKTHIRMEYSHQAGTSYPPAHPDDV